MSDVAPYSFTNPWSGVAQGMNIGNALRTTQANTDAGKALESGDYNGASNALLGSGQIDQGLAVRDEGKAQADAPKQKLLQFTAQTAQRLADYHRETNDPAKTVAAFDQIAPQFKALGESDADIAQVRAHLQADPETTLVALGAGAAKEMGYDVNVVDGNLIATDKKTGKGHIVATTSPQAAPAPQAAPGGPQAPSATPTATGGADPNAVWQSIKQQESGGLASPGTAVGPDTPYGNAQGSTQMLPATAESMARKLGIAWNPALMRENTPQALAYQDKIGRAYFDEGLQKSGGDPAGAAAYYFGGPDPSMHGPKTAAYVKSVMARAGQTAPVAPPAADTLTGGAGADQLGGPLILPPHQPEWKPDGKGFLHNVKTGDVKKDETFVAPDAPVDPNEVKMVLEGRYPAPTGGRAATDPKWQALLAAAAAQDPGFDAANYQTRVKTRQSFLSGPQSQNITALNTVVGHLDALDHSIDGLGNLGGFPGSHLNNQAAHMIAGASGTGTRLSTFNANKTAVANELTRVFRGTGGAEADIQAYMKQLDDANSPDELHTSVKSIAALIKSRLDAVADSYNQGMGLSKDSMEFLHPEQQRAFARLSGAGPSAADPAIAQARAAIAAGAPRAAVIQRLQQHGIDPSGL